jgi:hypothetical protein
MRRRNLPHDGHVVPVIDVDRDFRDGASADLFRDRNDVALRFAFEAKARLLRARGSSALAIKSLGDRRCELNKKGPAKRGLPFCIRVYVSRSAAFCGPSSNRLADACVQ